MKPITTGEGGAILTDDDNLAGASRKFRSHGITRDRAGTTADDGARFYEQHTLGYNYRLTDIQAALGASQLRKLESFIELRRRIELPYCEGLADVSGLGLPHVETDVEPGWHLFAVQVHEPARRKTFFEHLVSLGLLVQVHYVPVY